jgi:hypothetical protein
MYSRRVKIHCCVRFFTQVEDHEATVEEGPRMLRS